jgi:hypothetical protein
LSSQRDAALTAILPAVWLVREKSCNPKISVIGGRLQWIGYVKE